MRAARRRGAAAAALLLAVTGAAWGLAGRERPAVPSELRAVLLRAPAKIGTVQLVDHHDRRVTSDELFSGGWSFVFLGFAGCPNVCPATLAQLAAVKRALARQSAATPQPRYVFVSVDPQRDTPARLAGYVAAFDRDFIGATGAPAQVAALSDALTAFHRREAPGAGGDYGVVHSGEVYLLDPAGRVYARFTPPLEADLVARQVVSLMAYQAAGRS